MTTSRELRWTVTAAARRMDVRREDSVDRQTLLALPGDDASTARPAGDGRGIAPHPLAIGARIEPATSYTSAPAALGRFSPWRTYNRSVTAVPGTQRSVIERAPCAPALRWSSATPKTGSATIAPHRKPSPQLYGRPSRPRAAGAGAAWSDAGDRGRREPRCLLAVHLKLRKLASSSHVPGILRPAIGEENP